MARRLRELAAFLCIGAVINAALAMGIIWFGPVGEGTIEDFTFEGGRVQRFDTLGLTLLGFSPVAWDDPSLEEGSPPAWSRIHHLPRPRMSWQEWASLPDRAVHGDIAAGWPVRSLTYQYDIHPTRPQGIQYIIRSGIELRPRQINRNWGTWDHHRAIPTHVIPLGFAINSLLFAALAAMMWRTPPTIRRFRRSRANRCLRCGYPRAGLGAVCPECGAQTDQTRSEQHQQNTQNPASS